MRDSLESFFFLLKEARGFKNKLVIFKFALWNFLKRYFLRPLLLNDIFVELKEAKVWFGPFTGELASYKEIHRYQSYESYENFSAGPTDTVFDLGANIGFYTIQQAKRTKQGKVFAFEPNPSSYARLKKNIAANNLANVMLFNKAVYSRHGELGLESPSSTGTRTVLAENQPGKRVEGWTLDEIIREHPVERVDLMKIDVEGSEAEILKGGKNCLRITKKIVLEVHSKELEEQVATILNPYGFQKVFQKKLSKTAILYFVSEKTDI